MALVTESIFLDLILILIAVLYFLYWFFTNNNDYWDKRGVPNAKRDLMLGTLLGRQSQSDLIMEMYSQFSGEKFAGCFQMKKPVLIVHEPDLIHLVLVKDFNHFRDRGGSRQFKNDPLTSNLFNLRGYTWKSLRYKLTPTFTTGKLRAMFDQISRRGDSMIDRLSEFVEENNEIESREFLFEYTLDVISNCAFGLQFKPKEPEFNCFKNAVQRVLETSFNTLIRFLILFLCPRLASLMNLTAFPKDTTEYFFSLTKANLKYRKDNKICRNDYFQLLLSLKEQEDSDKEIALTTSDATEEDDVINQMHYTEENDQSSHINIKVLTEESICANSFIFLTAGSETIASSINFVLLSLAQHPDIQQRLQQETDAVLKQHRGWNYDAIKGMTYLDQVVQESQRMYSVNPFLIRECVLPYKVPDSELIIEKGVMIAIPVAGLHKDPQYYPEPDRFNPDRFEGNNFKPNPTFLPFGDGPRICIAMRFAVMEIKTCVARIMSQYTVKLGPKTQTPIKYDKKALVPAVEGGIWLNFIKRQKI